MTNQRKIIHDVARRMERKYRKHPIAAITYYMNKSGSGNIIIYNVVSVDLEYGTWRQGYVLPVGYKIVEDNEFDER